MYVRGQGQNERLFFSLQTPLLISPGSIGELIIRLDSVPSNSSFEHIDFDMTIDPAFSTLMRLEKITPGLSSSAIISKPTSIGNLLRFSITEPGGLRDTGAIIAVKLLAAAPGPECRDVRLDWQAYSPYGLSGHTQGEICINPSCRLPEGLHKATIPQMTVSPLPVRDQLTVLLSSESSLFTTVHLLDAQGRLLRSVYEGMLAQGTAIRQLSAARLPSGHYYLLLRCPFGERITPVLVEK